MASSANDAEEPTSTVGMIKGINSLEGGTHYMAESLKTFSMSDGKNKKGDVSVAATDMAGALVKLKEMVAAAQQAAPAGSKKNLMWNFRASPHVAMGKTLDDGFRSFLMWARTGIPGEEEEDEGSAAGLINVSKAFRRLESYADWMCVISPSTHGPLIDSAHGCHDRIFCARMALLAGRTLQRTWSTRR